MSYAKAVILISVPIITKHYITSDMDLIRDWTNVEGVREPGVLILQMRSQQLPGNRPQSLNLIASVKGVSAFFWLTAFPLLMAPYPYGESKS